MNTVNNVNDILKNFILVILYRSNLRHRSMGWQAIMSSILIVVYLIAFKKPENLNNDFSELIEKTREQALRGKLFFIDDYRQAMHEALKGENVTRVAFDETFRWNDDNSPKIEKKGIYEYFNNDAAIKKIFDDKLKILVTSREYDLIFRANDLWKNDSKKVLEYKNGKN